MTLTVSPSGAGAVKSGPSGCVYSSRDNGALDVIPTYTVSALCIRTSIIQGQIQTVCTVRQLSGTCCVAAGYLFYGCNVVNYTDLLIKLNILI